MSRFPRLDLWPTLTTGALLIALLSGDVCPPLAAAEASGAEPSAEANAEGAAALESLGRLPWYSRGEDQLRPVPVRPRIDDSVNRRSRWLPQDSTAPAPRPAPGATVIGRGSGLEKVVGWTVLIVVLMITITMLVYFYLRLDNEPALGGSGRSLRGGAEEEDLAARIEQLPEEVRSVRGDLRQTADRLRQQGRYDEAIIYLFGYQLLQLDRHHLLRLARGKTNRQYLRELALHGDLAAILNRTVIAFEDSYFGSHPLSARRFDACWEDLPVMEARLDQRRQEVA